MAGDTIAEARRIVEKRLEELRAETKRLESALRGLDGSEPKARSTRTRKRPATARRRRSGRAEQFKRALAKQPGAAVSEISKKLGISSQQGHGIAKRLRDRGEIKRQGKGYAVKP
jgi:septal ring factor EnvC (AmiA/AmiB activator)